MKTYQDVLSVAFALPIAKEEKKGVRFDWACRSRTPVTMSSKLLYHQSRPILDLIQGDVEDLLNINCRIKKIITRKDTGLISYTPRGGAAIPVSCSELASDVLVVEIEVNGLEALVRTSSLFRGPEFMRYLYEIARSGA